MKKASLSKKIVILVLVLVVPGFLYYLLTTEGKNRYKPLPVFGPKSLAKTTHKVKGKNVPDTVYHTLTDFNLTNQDGKPVSLKTFDNQIFVVDFFYTRCQGACSVANGYISLLDSNYAKNKMIRFVSITVDPEHDSTAVLKRYFNSFKPVPAKWMFLTGDTTTIYNLARKGFLVNALKTSNDDFIYSDKLILIDQDKRIRGYYTGASTDEMSKLNDEIKVLISEELRKNDKPLY
ncbi:protein SCO1/2 [Mucilaginibacter frigoritolerans]|uniref:Protein SCO1/2 n=1 Tax=Mucilaginibacter frigoritolerans TaxID=652788 RepID=A0A562U3W5_9SPHI|nr:SCO family protein [Mucilaginibacter frigoritolerans]TWJ00075.1 protein SCO1/2 [Mucilaginibacter frigoritolerans]